jgi:PAS domain S-box-containing protein
MPVPIEDISAAGQQIASFRKIAVGAAWFALALGLAMATAWLSHAPWLVAAFHDAFHLKFNTALGFVGAGIGLIALLRGSPRVARAAGGFVLLIGAATLLEYLTGTKLGLDQLFVNDFYEPHILYPGRPAPNTALALVLSGAGIVWAAQHRSLPGWRIRVTELIGFLVFSIGAEGASGHTRTVTFANPWCGYTHMAPSTSAGFISLGLGLMALARKPPDKGAARVPLWLPAILFLSIFLVEIDSPRGVAATVAYFPVIFCSLWFPRPRTAFVFAAVASLLTSVAYLLKVPVETTMWILVANRSLKVGAYWLTAVFLYQKRKDEGALRISEERYEALVRGLSIGVWNRDLVSNTQYCSPRMKEIFGMAGEDLAPNDAEAASLLHPEDRERVIAMLQAHIHMLGPCDTECRVRSRGGEYAWVHVTGQAIWDESGKPLRIVGSMDDITARKQVEEALRVSNASEQQLILGVKDYAILMLDQNGVVTTWNEGAERMKGYRAEEIVGRHYSKFYTPEAIAEGKPSQELQIAVEQGRFEEVGWRIRKDGSRFWADIVITALFEANGKLRGFGKVTRDISERKAVEAEREKIAAELARYTLALERSNRELDAFAYAASHDLKAPLRVIHNASTWIEEDLAGQLTAETQENMDLLRSRVRRMDKLLDDLLEYSRIGRETDNSHTEAISGTVLMENILGLIAPPEGFIVDANSTLAGIEIFRMPLQQILINLISNAIKHHHKKGGRIEVSVEDLGAMFRFRVKDDGPGIPAQYHEQIFKMFQTLKPKDQVEGSGMGLAMVRKHVDVAGGELKLESAVGQGSTFSFTWPRDNGSTNKTKHKFTRSGETR